MWLVVAVLGVGWLMHTDPNVRGGLPLMSMGICGAGACSRGGLRADHVVGVGMSTYPLLRSRLLRVPPLRRVTLEKSPKVTKGLLPHHSVPRLGSVCPHSGLNPWAAVMGHPWPRTANPASCRVTHGFKPAFGQRG